MAADVDDQRVAESIFANGLTTAGSISPTSGRGVGMGAIKFYLEQELCSIFVDLDQSKQQNGFVPAIVRICLTDRFFIESEGHIS